MTDIEPLERLIVSFCDENKQLRMVGEDLALSLTEHVSAWHYTQHAGDAPWGACEVQTCIDGRDLLARWWEAFNDG